MMTRHQKIVSLFWSDKSVSEVAYLCRCTQRRVREAWQLATRQGDLPPIERPRDGFGQLSIFLGSFHNEGERRFA